MVLTHKINADHAPCLSAFPLDHWQVDKLLKMMHRTALLSAETMLARLTPLKPILCVVAQTSSYYGLAVSDAYLGSARPLPSVASLHDLEEACWAENAGALTLALPLSGDVPTAENIRDGLYYKLLHDDRLNARIPLLTTINDPMSLTEARREAQANVELWEAIDLDDPSPSRDAAVALNSFLWKHTGGWRNTFG